MCDDKKDKNGWFTFLTIRAKYTDNPEGALLHVRLHNSRYNQVSMLEMGAKELYLSIVDVTSKKKAKPQ